MIKKIEYKGYTIHVKQDDCPESPRKMFDHETLMVCFHRRYTLGDEHSFTIESAGELRNSGEVYSLPLYLYDHSGQTISTEPFSCPWDSGKIGFICINKEKAKKFWPDDPEKGAHDLMKSEVEEYDQWLRGEVYGYSITDETGKERDSCWGYYGDPEKSGCIEDAKSLIDAYIESRVAREISS